MMRLKK